MDLIYRESEAMNEVGPIWMWEKISGPVVQHTANISF